MMQLVRPAVEYLASHRASLECARRYRTRAGLRHAGHLDQVRNVEELWNDEISEPVAGGWPVVEVDTNAPAERP